VGNCFAILPSRVFNLEEEWGRFVTVLFAVAAKTIGTQGRVSGIAWGCPQARLSSLQPSKLPIWLSFLIHTPWLHKQLFA